MDEMFRLEYHPINGHPRRVRFLVTPGENELERVTERRANGSWKRVDVETIDYFEYSDG